MNLQLTESSNNRVKRFVDMFLSSDYWDSMRFGSSSDMWIQDAERAQRCNDAAENGGDGSTHYEVIQDMRAAADSYIRDKHKFGGTYRFRNGISAYFDQLELWHEENGSLHNEIG